MHNMPEENKSLALPSTHETSPASRVERVAYYQVPAEETDLEHSQTPLSHYLWVLRRRKWALLLFVVFSVAATIIVSSRMTPIYESTATVDVDRMIPTAVVGQESTARASSMNDSDAKWICGPTGSRRCAVRRDEARSSKGGMVSHSARLFEKS